MGGYGRYRTWSTKLGVGHAREAKLDGKFHEEMKVGNGVWGMGMDMGNQIWGMRMEYGK